MYGLRSGRLCATSGRIGDVDQTKETAQYSTSTNDRQPSILNGAHHGVAINSEPETHSVPNFQSPYFHPSHGISLFNHHSGHTLPQVEGGGLEEEEYNFDAGFVISSQLSQMVANGAYSYPSPQPNTAEPNSHTPSHPTYLGHTSSPSIHVKIEPGLPLPHATPTRAHHTNSPASVRVKSEPSNDPLPLSCPHAEPLPVRVKAEFDDTPLCTHTPSDPHATTPTVRVKTEPGVADKKPAVKSEDIEDHWEPPLWRVQYDNICQMRRERTAPVDTHGCFMLAERDVPPHVRRYQVLVSLMLSSQTKDQITGKAMTNLKKHGLTVENILTTPREDIAKMINAVGFWQKKSDYIKRTTEAIASKYNGDIPNTLKELMSLPGVGPKMANLVMDFAWGQVTGIAVDTHVHRISHRLGWMRKQNPTPEATRIALEKWLPMSEWSNLNLMLVGFGQTLCSPQRPHCEDCLNRNICPSSLACNDATMGGLAGNFTPEALTTGKKKKKSKAATPIKGESQLVTLPEGGPLLIENSASPIRKKRKLKKKEGTD